MLKRANKNKKHLPSPPLSAIDKIIYFILLILVAILMFALMLLIFRWQDNYVFSNSHVLAYYNSASMLWLLLPLLVLTFSPLVFIGTMMTDKQPIFGNPKIKYGISAQYREVYPLFGKQRRRHKEPLTPNKKAMRNLGRKFIIICYVAAAFIGAFGLFGRYELTNTSIIKYNALNMISNQYSLNDAVSYTFRTYDDSSYRSWSELYSFSLNIKMKNGRKFIFAHSDFRSMEEIKEIETYLHGIPKYIEGVKNLPKVIDDLQLNEEEKAILYDLFDIKNK